jgi:hypothetical protein
MTHGGKLQYCGILLWNFNPRQLRYCGKLLLYFQKLAPGVNVIKNLQPFHGNTAML